MTRLKEKRREGCMARMNSKDTKMKAERIKDKEGGGRGGRGGKGGGR